VPIHTTAPIVADMASTILSREFDVGQLALIDACAQKILARQALRL